MLCPMSSDGQMGQLGSEGPRPGRLWLFWTMLGVGLLWLAAAGGTWIWWDRTTTGRVTEGERALAALGLSRPSRTPETSLPEVDALIGELALDEVEGLSLDFQPPAPWFGDANFEARLKAWKSSYRARSEERLRGADFLERLDRDRFSMWQKQRADTFLLGAMCFEASTGRLESAIGRARRVREHANAELSEAIGDKASARHVTLHSLTETWTWVVVATATRENAGMLRAATFELLAPPPREPTRAEILAEEQDELFDGRQRLAVVPMFLAPLAQGARAKRLEGAVKFLHEEPMSTKAVLTWSPPRRGPGAAGAVPVPWWEERWTSEDLDGLAMLEWKARLNRIWAMRQRRQYLAMLALKLHHIETGRVPGSLREIASSEPLAAEAIAPGEGGAEPVELMAIGGELYLYQPLPEEGMPATLPTSRSVQFGGRGMRLANVVPAPAKGSSGEGR
jgi:hypothetical protein